MMISVMSDCSGLVLNSSNKNQILLLLISGEFTNLRTAKSFCAKSCSVTPGVESEALEGFLEETGADKVDHIGLATACAAHDDDWDAEDGSLDDHEDLHVAIMGDHVPFFG